MLIHKYGPHIFHTNSRDVFDYLSRSPQWRPYQHRVLACVDGQLVPMPINLDTINTLYGLNLTSFELEEFFASVAEPRADDPHLRRRRSSARSGASCTRSSSATTPASSGGSTRPSSTPSVTARVPVRTNRDDRYFTDTYQAMPLHGYTRMFERMLRHPNIKVMLNTRLPRGRGRWSRIDEVIYTGPIDEFFDFRFGKLPYRSLDFQLRDPRRAGASSRRRSSTIRTSTPTLACTEFKYLTGQEHPQDHAGLRISDAPKGDPYYPVPDAGERRAVPANTRRSPRRRRDVHFVGRLATYQYYNMDQVVGAGAGALPTSWLAEAPRPVTQTA